MTPQSSASPTILPERSEGSLLVPASMLTPRTRKCVAKPPGAQVQPVRIHRFYERNLSVTQPISKLSLPLKRRTAIRIRLEVDEYRQVVSSRESRNSFLFVLPNALFKTIRHTDIERSGRVRHDVDEKFSHLGRPHSGGFDLSV